LEQNQKDDNFERNWRRKQEIKMRPHADLIYRNVFGENSTIKRYGKNDNFVLDKVYAIDSTIGIANGMLLNGQEKFLSNNYATYHSLTVEYEQNQTTGERGDWFKLACQIYFVGYINITGDGFDIWSIMNWPSIAIETMRDNIRWLKNGNNSSRASFMYTDLYALPNQCIVSCSWK